LGTRGAEGENSPLITVTLDFRARQVGERERRKQVTT
jgi:hypothetical protein